jgi:hypothetical protein
MSQNFPVGGSGIASKILSGAPKHPYNPPANTIVPGSIPASGQDSNRLDSVTVVITGVAGQFGYGDVLVQLPKPCLKIMISSLGGSIGQQAASFGLQIHFAPLNIDYGTSSYVDQGTENWINLHDGEDQSVTYLDGTLITFRNPITRFLMDIQGPIAAGDTYAITWVCADDICDINWKPQAATIG